MKTRLLLAGLAALLLLAPAAGVRSETSDEVYVFKIKVVADQYYREFRANPKVEILVENRKKEVVLPPKSWRKDLNNAAAKANEEMRKQGVKVRFEIAEVAPWEIAKESDSMFKALEDLARAVAKDDCDLVIGFTRKNFQPLDASGYYWWAGYIVVQDCAFIDPQNLEINDSFGMTVRILLHELGHFLGLDHSKDPNSIMAEKWKDEFSTQRFTAEEIRLMNKNAEELARKKKGKKSN